MERTVQLSEYSGLVAAVLAQAEAALAPQGGNDEHTAKRIKAVTEDHRRFPASEAALRGRFALGSDSAAYLGNGVALLSAGIPGNEAPIQVPQGGDVMAGVRNAVYKEIERRRQLDRVNAPRALAELKKVIAWMLSIPDVALGVREIGTDDDDLDKLLEKMSYEELRSKAMEKAGLDPTATPEDDELNDEAQESATKVASDIDKRLAKMDAAAMKKLLQIFETLLDPEMDGPAAVVERVVGKIAEEYTAYARDAAAVRAAITDREKQWQAFKQVVYDQATGPPPAPDAGVLEDAVEDAPHTSAQADPLARRFDALQQEIEQHHAAAEPAATGVAAAAAATTYTSRFTTVEPTTPLSFEWMAMSFLNELPRSEWESESLFAMWIMVTGHVAGYSPAEERGYLGPFPYQIAIVEAPQRLLKASPTPPFASGRLDEDETIRTELANRYTKYSTGLAFCAHHCNALLVDNDNVVVDDTNYMTWSSFRSGVDPSKRPHTFSSYVRWLPQGVLAEEQAMATILEHIVQNTNSWMNEEGGENVYGPSVAAAAKLRQLSHLQNVRIGVDKDVPHADTETSIKACTGMTTAANWDYYGLRASAVGLRYADEDRIISMDDGFKREPRKEIQALLASTDAGERMLARGYRDAARDGKEVQRKLFEVLGVNVGIEVPPMLDISVAWKDDKTVESFTKATMRVTRQVHGKTKNVAIDPSKISTAALLAHVREAQRMCALITDTQPAATPDPPLEPTSGPEVARGALWAEMLREISISGDKLFVFVKLLSGAMGESSETLLTVADESTQRAQKAFQDARKEIMEKTAAFHSKLVESVVGAVLRSSKLEAIPDHEGSSDQLFVADAELAKDLRALASGESGRPFFEANVAIQGILRTKNGKRTSMTDLIASFNPIVEQLHATMERDLAASAGGSLGMAALSAPRNSYMVSLREDVVACIRVAYDRLCHEVGHRRVSLYELVEGASSSLTLRFAEFVAHVLVATRASSGTSALYVSQTTMHTNILQTRAALGRLVTEVRGYMAAFKPPNFLDPDGREKYFNAATGQTIPITPIAQSYVAPTVVVGRVLVNSDVSGWAPGQHPFLR